MLEARMAFPAGSAEERADCLGPVHSLLAQLQDFAGTAAGDTAPHDEIVTGSPHPLALRYAAANTITRRRFDALLREAETAGTVGLHLIMARGGRSDPGTIAAARFLGNMIDATLRKLDNLMSAPSARP